MKKLLRTAEPVICSISGVYALSLIISIADHPAKRLDNSIILMLTVPAMLIASFIRICLTHFTPDSIHTAVIVDNLYLCTISSLTVRVLGGLFIAEHAGAMIILNLLLLIKAPEPELDEMKPTWWVVGAIQAAGLTLILTS